MNILIVTPKHTADRAGVIWEHNGNTTVHTVSPEVFLLNRRYIKGLSPDLVVLSSVIDFRDIPDCETRAKELIEGNAKGQVMTV